MTEAVSQQTEPVTLESDLAVLRRVIDDAARMYRPDLVESCRRCLSLLQAIKSPSPTFKWNLLWALATKSRGLPDDEARAALDTGAAATWLRDIDAILAALVAPQAERGER